MKLLTVDEMIAVEKAADAAGHSYASMMEFAGKGLAEIVHREFGDQTSRKVIALVGRGNNGGDALVALEYLIQWGWAASAILAGREMDDLVRRAQAAGCRVLIWPELSEQELADWIAEQDVLLDGLLGTGIHLPLRPPVDTLLRAVGLVRHENLIVVAVDTPSGVDCRTGQAAPETLAADLTVTMAAAKTGHFAHPAAGLLGELVLAEIGLPPDLPAWMALQRFVLDRELVASLLPPRPANAHKGTFGTVMVASGSRFYAGALLLAGTAAYRSGAGLVTVACPRDLALALAGHFIEGTWLPLPDRDGMLDDTSAEEVLSHLDRVDALLVGPGLGNSASTRLYLERLLAEKDALPSLVIDADALRLVGGMAGGPAALPGGSVLTPHPGEMSAMTGLSVKEVQQSRVLVAEEFADVWGQVVVLKGAFTVIASPDGRTRLCPFSTPALARAGTGDVLAGMIAGLRAQGLDAFSAASLGVWLHARAGILAGTRAHHPAAVMAGDVLDAVGAALAELSG